MASGYAIGFGVAFGLLLLLVVTVVVWLAVTASRVKKLAGRWGYAYFSKTSCEESPPVPFCNPPTRPAVIPAVSQGQYQSDVVFYILSAVGIMVDYVQQKIPKMDLPGNPQNVHIFGTDEHPLLAVMFKSSNTAFVIFRGTGNLADLLDIDFARSQALGSFIGLAKGLLSLGFPTVMSFPQTDVTFGKVSTKVHIGFWEAYKSIRDRLLAALKNEAPQLVCVGGHSMGGSISQLCALDLASNVGYSVVMYAVATTRVGNGAFADALKDAIPSGFNFKNTEDAIPNGIGPVLPNFASDQDKDILDYTTSGHVISVTTHAPSLVLCHSLVAYELGIKARDSAVGVSPQLPVWPV